MLVMENLSGNWQFLLSHAVSDSWMITGKFSVFHMAFAYIAEFDCFPGRHLWEMSETNIQNITNHYRGNI